MSWQRSGAAPDKIKVSFEIRADQYPELARWYWSLPFRKGSEILREILATAVKRAGAVPVSSDAAPDSSRPPFQLTPPSAEGASNPANQTIPGRSPTPSEMSHAVTDLLKSMDQTF